MAAETPVDIAYTHATENLAGQRAALDNLRVRSAAGSLSIGRNQIGNARMCQAFLASPVRSDRLASGEEHN
jgi:hypothetical protein